ncbi:MAG: phage terminase large subunit [Blastopirellula sp. JB062]
MTQRLKDRLSRRTKRPIIEVPAPLPHQLPILCDAHRHKRVICGRRWGKTGAGLIAAILGHGAPAGPQHWKGIVDGGNLFWVAPTFAQSKKIERDIIKAFAGSGLPYSKTEGRIAHPSGGSITIKTAASPVSLRGEGLDGVIGDEFAFVPREIWSDALRPALSDRRGWSMFLTTPNGPNWIKEQCELDGIDPAYKTWQCPTSDNRLIDQAEIDAAWHDLGPASFRQEYLAQFVDLEGAEFSGLYFQTPDFWFDQWPPDSTVRYRVIGLDPSKGKSDKSDFSAFVLMALTYDGRIYVDADIERRDVSKISERAFELGEQFRPHGLIVETNQFQELLRCNIEDLAKRRGVTLPIYGKTNRDNKRTRIRRTLTPYLSRGEFRFKANSRGAKRLVTQLQEFPIGAYDDGPDALELGITLLADMLHARK